MRVIPKQNVGELSLKASGTLPNGSPVVINNNNEVSVVEDTRGVLGDQTKIMNNSRCDYVRVVYDSHHDRVVVFYKDYSSNGNAEHGKAVVYTVDSTNNTLKDAGSVVTFNSGVTNYISACFDSNANKILVAYLDVGDSQQGMAIVGEVDPSNNSITFGTAEQFYNNPVNGIETAFNTQHNVVGILYGNESNHPNLVVAEIDSGATTMTFGSELAINGTQGGFSGSLGICYHVTQQDWVVVYRGANSYPYTNCISYNGSSPTLHSQIQIKAYDNSNVTESYSKVIYIPSIPYADSGHSSGDSGEHVVYLYNQASGTRGIAVVGEVSGGSVNPIYTKETVIGNGWDDNTGGANFIGAVWNSTSKRLIVCYADSNNSNYVTLIEGFMTPGNIESKIQFSNERHLLSIGTNSSNMRLAYDSTNNRAILAFSSGSFNNEGVAYVYKSSDESIGTQTTHLSAANGYGGITGDFYTFDETAQRLVVVTQNVNDSNHGYVAIGTVSGTTLTWGTPIEFSEGSAITSDIDVVYDENVGKCVIFYRIDSGAAKYRVIDAIDTSDNSCTFGSSANWNSGHGASYINAKYDPDEQKIAIFFSDLESGNSSRLSGIVGTLNGGANTVSFGTKKYFDTTACYYILPSYDTIHKLFIVVYTVSNDGRAKAIKINGTTLGPVANQTTTTGDGHILTAFQANVGYLGIAYDRYTGKHMVTYTDSADNNYPKGKILQWSGGRIIASSATRIATATNCTNTYVAFDESTSRFVVVYRDGQGPYSWTQYAIRVQTGQIGASNSHAPVFDSPIQLFNSANYPAVFYIRTLKKIVVFYESSGDRLSAQIIDYSGTNLAPNNFIGFTTGGTVASGSNATVQTTGTVNKHQSGLTTGATYFVQQDGTLNTGQSDPSVVAGRALSATELLVKVGEDRR
jgi:hypothetical protein